MDSAKNKLSMYNKIFTNNLFSFSFKNMTYRIKPNVNIVSKQVIYYSSWT